jgi:hypothetical protein
VLVYGTLWCIQGREIRKGPIIVMVRIFEGWHGVSDPSHIALYLFRYEGEIGFFDYYIIPLAKKLEKCGVFGVSSHEYRTYALENRQEWAEKGKDMVSGYLTKFNTLFATEETNEFANELWC